MKTKFGLMWRVAVALALILSLGLVMAAPAAADVSSATVTIPTGENVISIEGTYTITFTTTKGMTDGVNTITITFPTDTTVLPEATFTDADVTAGDTATPAAVDNVLVDGRVVTITVGENIPAGSVSVIFATGHGNILNPSTAVPYTLSVHTDLEPTDVTSAAYSITDPPGPVDVWDSATPSVYRTSKDTIDAALIAATDGETIKIHPGTYNESSLKPGDAKALTIQSLTGESTGTGSAADTIISDSMTGSEDFILAGHTGTGDKALTVKGLTITNTKATADGNGVRAQVGASGALIVTNCAISNFLRGVATEGSATNTRPVTITDSTISGCDIGVAMFGDGNKLTLTGSTISGNTSVGVTLQSGVSSVNTLIYKNTFQNNTGYAAIEFQADGGSMAAAWSSTNAISYNNFLTNVYGIRNDKGDAVPAPYNWWGDISGPSCGDPTAGEASTALGSGDKITDKDTNFEPWLSGTYEEAYTDNIRLYASLLSLDAGWNTLSVPLALKSGADTLQDIVDLGDYIISDPTDLNRNFAGGYYYDAVLHQWQPLTYSYQFAPCQAVYVKMLADAEFPVVYSGQFSLPSQSLPAGWNLIGSAFGIDKNDGGNTEDYGDYGVATATATSPDTDSFKTVATALASLGANASVVISPSVPGQVAPWGTVATDDETKMIVGEGYWVFMEAADTLVGFEVTPLYFVFPAP